MERIINRLFELAADNNKAINLNLSDWSRDTAAMAGGLAVALEYMGYGVVFETCISGDYTRISKLEVTDPGDGGVKPPEQEKKIPNTLYLFRPLAEFGEVLKESCPPNDCIIYRNIYEMYCTRLEDYKRILATCPNLAEGTVRVLESSIYGLIKQLHDMWETNIAVNRKREAMRSEKEHKARIAAKARE